MPILDRTSNNWRIASDAVVCDKSNLGGDITIGSKTIIHPGASIYAIAGPIVIGEGNIIEEGATIINSLPPDSPKPTTPVVQTVGNYNVFEVYSTCEALKVGDNNVLEAKASIGRDVELSNGCVIGVACSLTQSETISENTVVYGSQCQRREMNDKPYPQFGQIDFLMKILPNYHHLRKPKTKPIKGESSV